MYLPGGLAEGARRLGQTAGALMGRRADKAEEAP